MFKFAILLSVLSVSLVVGYNFDDAEYNEILMQDIFDASEITGESQMVMPLGRARRETEKKDSEKKDSESKDCKSSKKDKEQHYKCCEDSTEKEGQSEKIKELKKQCFNEVRGSPMMRDARSRDNMFSCEGVNRTKTEIACVMQCVGQKQKTIDQNGNIIEAEIKKFMKNEFLADWLKDKSDAIVDKCIKETKEDEVVMKSKRDTEAAAAAPKECNKSTLKFSHCIFREITMACPKDKQKDTKTCTKLREKLERGEMINFHHHHHHGHHHDD